MAATCPECDREAVARGLCMRHYHRLRAAGGVPPIRSLSDAAPVIDGQIARVPLTLGLVAVIDVADVNIVRGRRWAAHRGNNGGYYAASRTLRMHRIIVGAPDDVLVDHVNGDPLDNRRANLRTATQTDNNRNRRCVRIDTISGFAGVGFHRQTGKWRARVNVPDGRRVSLGLFSHPEDAALARDAYIRAHCASEFWTFNFPMPGERGIDRERTSA